MVLGLYVVAGVMVAGGLLAIYSGSDIIVMERGWTMVISGSVMAASGALLAGIATAVARLQMLEDEFTRLADRLTRPEGTSFSLQPDFSPAPPLDRSSAPPPPAGPGLAELKDPDIAAEPSVSPAPPQRPRTEPPPVLTDEGDELFELAAPPAAAREPSTAASTEPAPGAQETEPAPGAQETEAEGAATVVGTYNSGGNFYIMYSDGSIEAETPAGKFRFTSLEELKEFIAAGGDKAKTATPA
jgi:hypothetical protein